ncbi:ABC transporter ATP-binding protein [Thermosyntropha sp.]|uniref:ABC transporter ATP-binding protein n=1 Tax=Thermosyntropha sp. TaxID=2740820 RepID=UPI002600A36A|nr:ABC transporter ATP-binding protein [Thermosyntropha sp.]MBO8158238.1 ABC transporter ATP-binding protein [Thermosyntropha sp.]
MALICLKNIANSYCLKNINLTIQDGELMVLLGSTGAGKSTLLNVIAGLTPYEGEVYFNGRNMNLIPPEKRGIGYLFQDIALFPHLCAYDNIAFSLRAAKCPKDEVKRRVEEIMQLMHISHLKDRYPKELSGGEKQRVGLARALVRKPEILLLDEPLSSLDPATACSIRRELKQLKRELKLTILYVTHNYAEAGELADRIAVIMNGELKRLGSPEEILNNLTVNPS